MYAESLRSTNKILRILGSSEDTVAGRFHVLFSFKTASQQDEQQSSSYQFQIPKQLTGKFIKYSSL